MTLLKQQISLIPFSIDHWYSPYKRRRFENRSDQTFCILPTEDVLSAIESANLRRRQNLNQKRSRLIWIRMSLDYPFQNCGYIRRRHSFRQLCFKSAIGCMTTKKTEKCKQMSENRSVLKKMKYRNPRAYADHHQKPTTSGESPLDRTRACQVWLTSVSAFVSYPVYR